MSEHRNGMICSEVEDCLDDAIRDEHTAVVRANKLASRCQELEAISRQLEEALRGTVEWLPQRTDIEDPDDARDFARFIRKRKAILKLAAQAKVGGV